MSKKTIIALISYLFFTLIYIHPGEVPFLSRDTTQVLSDGTDPVTFPYQFSFLINRFKESPGDFLYGAIFNPYQDAPEGLPLWIPAIERIEVLFLSLFVPVEQISTGLVIIGMTLNGLFMFLLARALSIPNLISWGMGAAWAFSAYTRARAKVHMGLVGIYHLPLIFLSIILLGKDDRKSKILGILGFLLISFMPHYYVVTLASLTPLLILFIWLQAKSHRNPKKFITHILLASLPAICWLTWSVTHPLPSTIERHSSPFPTTGEYTGNYHPYLDHFSASPIDYFTGDVGIGVLDLNFFKEQMNLNLYKEQFRGSNSHERALGIRWLIWILSLVAIVTLFKKNQFKWESTDRSTTYFFILFAFTSFWLSMPPNWPIEGFAASLWLHKLIAQIRVPNRAGIGVAFSLIIISGLFIKNLLNSDILDHKKKKLIILSFATLILFELPPLLNFMPLSQVQAPVTELTNNVLCGTGFSYPYDSAQNNGIKFYYLLQRLRGSKCKIINSATTREIDQKMLNHFSETSINNKVKSIDEEINHLRQVVNCTRVSWILFNPPVNIESAQKLCQGLEWTWTSSGVCSGFSQSIEQVNLNLCL